MPSDEVRASDENDSELPHGDQPSGSVYDFLYHDARRVGSFLAQFETYGVPSQVKATESTGRSGVVKTAVQVGFKVLAKAEGALEVTSGDDERDTAERTYDPLWTNARMLLDYLAEHGLVQQDVFMARLGQFVLAKGTLIVLDAAMLKAAWGKSSVKKIVAASAPSQKNAKADMDLILDLLPILPHSIQANLVGAGYTVWCGLANESLVGSSSDVVLKHGAYVQGEWHLLGILDALPDSKDEPVPGEEPPQHIDDVVAAHAGTMVGGLAAKLAPVVRELLGRPRTAYGMTPLLIFREVSAEQ